jgi:urease accessory protein
MITIAQTFLGNALKDAALRYRVEQSRRTGECLEVELTQNDSLKSRIHTQASNGNTVGIIKERGWLVTEGDVFETDLKQLLIIHLQAQEVLVLRFDAAQPASALALIHLGHVLGNHHYPILVTPDCIYVQLVADKQIMAATIENFQIPGLSITYESRSFDRQLAFQSHTHPHAHLHS